MEKLLTKREVSNLLAINVATVNTLMRRGLPFVCLGGRRSRTRFEPEKVKRWLVQNREKFKK